MDELKHKPNKKCLNFDDDGNIKATFDPPESDEGREIVTPEQSRGAYDPVTALLQMLAGVALSASCDATGPVFDGKRRFDITGTNAGTSDIDEKDYNSFKGTARMCDVEFKMI